MAGVGYVVAWPHASIQIEGVDRVFAKGEVLPEGHDPRNTALLVSVGALTVVIVGGTPAEPVVVNTDPASTTSTVPAKSASVAAWVDWAVANGATREEAEGSTKKDLIARYAVATPAPATTLPVAPVIDETVVVPAPGAPGPAGVALDPATAAAGDDSDGTPSLPVSSGS